MRLPIIPTVLALSALTMNAMEPQIYPGYCFNGIAPDASLAVSYAYGTMIIIDLNTGVSNVYEEGYVVSTGNYVSNTGIVVASTMAETACYWKNGEWHDIESGLKHVWSYANGITPDGTRIVGSVTPDSGFQGYEGLMLVPCYWDIQSDGTYGEVNQLPSPNEDFIGRTPQYITAVQVSEDGKTIAGQIIDYSGAVAQPIVYTQDNDGNWSYTLLIDELFHPDGLSVPVSPEEAPMIEDFMKPEKAEEYADAVKLWEMFGNGDIDLYPDYMEYMTEEEYEEYRKATSMWYVEWNKFEIALQSYINAVPVFGMNNVFLSADGKKYITSGTYKIDGTTFYTPFSINIADGTYEIYPQTDIHPILSSVAADGTMLAQVIDDYSIRNAYIMPAGTTEFIPLQDYVAQVNPEVAKWMKENLVHEIIGAEWNDSTGEYEPSISEGYATGIPFVTPDMSTFLLAVENDWDYENGYITYGYIFRLATTGIHSIDSGISEKDSAVYNLQGIKAGNNLEGLPKGIYIVNGKKVLVK